jgi:hypothetical protein
MVSRASLIAFGMLVVTLVPSMAWARFSDDIAKIGYVLVAGMTCVAISSCVPRLYVSEVVASIKSNAILIAYLIASFGVLLFAHGGARFSLMLGYAFLGCSFAVVLPLYFLSEERRIEKWAAMVVVITLFVTVTAIMGVVGVDNLGGIPLFVKCGYTNIGGLRSSAGIFEQLTTFGLLLVFAIYSAIYLAKVQRRPGYIVLAALFLLMLIVLQSRSAILALAVSGSILVLFRGLTPRVRYLIPVAVVVFGVAPFLILKWLALISPFLDQYLRLSVGLSGREAGWLLALVLIADSPIFGHGLGSSSEMTLQYGAILGEGHFYAAGASFHNTFLTKAVDMGIGVALVYILVYVVPLVRVVRSSMPLELKRYIAGCLIGISIVAFFVDINVGGARLTVFASSFFIGIGAIAPAYYPNVSSHAIKKS